MNAPSLTSLETLVEAIPDGALLAVPKDSSGVAMAATRALLGRKVHDLHLLCVPVGGLQADLLIGTGAVSVVETSAITLGEFGTAPCFTQALHSASLRILDATCPAIYAALQAGEKNIPFIPLRGMIGTDLLRHRSDWKVIDNPFSPGDPIVLLPSIRPDVALFHARYADREGNIFIGKEREVLLMAHAAKTTLVTVEEIVDGNLLDDPARGGAVLPSIYVSAIAVAKHGAWPLALSDLYAMDDAAIARYITLARTVEGLEQFIGQWDSGVQAAA
ncbi:MAG TPA: CoA-transferase [Burkholderiales bacterium]|jgi:glutaconate CoA-transferase subunit A|nr:CoA-transferase [Burkholderiales bacterium]